MRTINVIFSPSGMMLALSSLFFLPAAIAETVQSQPPFVIPHAGAKPVPYVPMGPKMPNAGQFAESWGYVNACQNDWENGWGPESPAVHCFQLRVTDYYGIDGKYAFTDFYLTEATYSPTLFNSRELSCALNYGESKATSPLNGSKKAGSLELTVLNGYSENPYEGCGTQGWQSRYDPDLGYWVYEDYPFVGEVTLQVAWDNPDEVRQEVVASSTKFSAGRQVSHENCKTVWASTDQGGIWVDGTLYPFGNNESVFGYGNYLMRRCTAVGTR